jgi:hypothetical protein
MFGDEHVFCGQLAKCLVVNKDSIRRDINFSKF